MKMIQNTKYVTTESKGIIYKIQQGQIEEKKLK